MFNLTFQQWVYFFSFAYSDMKGNGREDFEHPKIDSILTSAYYNNISPDNDDVIEEVFRTWYDITH